MKRVSTMTESEPMWNLTVWRYQACCDGCLQSLLNARACVRVCASYIFSRKRKRITLRNPSKLNRAATYAATQLHSIFSTNEWIAMRQYGMVVIHLTQSSYSLRFGRFVCGNGSSTFSPYVFLSFFLATMHTTYDRTFANSIWVYNAKHTTHAFWKQKAACFFLCRICFVNLQQIFESSYK